MHQIRCNKAALHRRTVSTRKKDQLHPTWPSSHCCHRSFLLLPLARSFIWLYFYYFWECTTKSLPCCSSRYKGLWHLHPATALSLAFRTMYHTDPCNCQWRAVVPWGLLIWLWLWLFQGPEWWWLFLDQSQLALGQVFLPFVVTGLELYGLPRWLV